MSFLLVLNYIIPCSSVSLVRFEHVIASWMKTFQQYILLSLEAFRHIPPTLRFAINYTYKKVNILVIFTGANFMLNMIEEFMASRSFKKIVQCLEKHLFILKFFRKKFLQLELLQFH